eukprot:554226_1
MAMGNDQSHKNDEKIAEDGDIHFSFSQYKPIVEEQKNNKKKLKPKASFPSIKIVHISDTHLAHNEFTARNVPKGDILIHSGDFISESPSTFDKNNKEIPKEIIDFNRWLGTLKHKHKIVIAGNHELSLDGLGKNNIQKILSNCIYLEDSFVELYGIKIFGSPWTKHIYGTVYAFGDDENNLHKKWNVIPNDTDILVTHQPPYGILDRAWQRTFDNDKYCDICNEVHKIYDHWGSISLRTAIETRIKPYVHLFGHVHDENGIVYDKKSGVRYINSAMDIEPVPHTFNCVFDLE